MMMPLFMPVDEWLQAFTPPFDEFVKNTLRALYGDESAVWSERSKLIRQALGAYREHYGSGPVLISRAPARLSFNPHSDHQGSFVLYACHAREILLIAGWRDDDVFALANEAPEFASGLQFTLNEEIGRAQTEWNTGWGEYLESSGVKSIVAETKDPKTRLAGRTGTLNYVKGAVLRLAHARPGEINHGLNLLVCGDIHYGAGQSSSSAIVVSTALAINAIYHLGIERKELVRLLGEAEWYVGTRGGSGDQAAMLLGQRGMMTNIQFIPPLRFRDLRTVEFPEGYQILIVNSGTRSEKSSAEKRMFNQGVFAYKFAYNEMLRTLDEKHRSWGIPSELVSGTHWLADFNTERMALHRIYDCLLSLPFRMPMEEVQRRYSESFSALARSFFDTDDLDDLPADIPLRGAAMYGVGRADRGMVQDGLLATGTPEAMSEFGRLHSIAHDGDRLFRRNSAGEMVDYTGHLDQLGDGHISRLRDLAQHAERGSEDWLSAQFRRQPGFYGASVRPLDLIVDLAKSTEGVLGAGLMGAGGGGVVLVVARDGEEIENRIRQRMVRDYFDPEGMSPDIERWQSVQGAGVLSIFAPPM